MAATGATARMVSTAHLDATERTARPENLVLEASLGLQVIAAREASQDLEGWLARLAPTARRANVGLGASQDLEANPARWARCPGTAGKARSSSSNGQTANGGRPST